MLDGLRDFAKTIPGKILGGFMLIGLAGFGISGVLTSTSLNTVAKVGSETITSVQFQRNYNSQLNAISQQTGSTPTAEQAIAFGIPSSVINQLGAEASMNELAKKLGLGASDKRLGEMLRSDPSFGGTLGNFEAENFRDVLRRNGWTEKEYFEMQRKSIQRQQIAMGLFGGIKAPNAASSLVNHYGFDKRDVEYFIVNDENMLPPADPTQSEIAQYLSDNQDAYQTQTLRNVKLIQLSPAIIAKDMQISEQELKDEYERTKANYIKIETREISQVSLENELFLKRFELGLDGGEKFNALISETGLVATTLGTMNKAQILDKQLADAAFALANDEFAIISGIGGKRAIYVSNIVEGGQRSFEDLREQIADKLKLSQAKEMYVDLLDNIEELRASFTPFEDIAAKYKLDIIETKITQAGNGLEAVSKLPEGGATKIADAIFRANIDSLSPTVALGSSMNIWFDLISIEPARDQNIAEVGEEIKDKLLKDKVDNALQIQVDKLVASIKSGDDFASTAVGAQYILAQSNELTRQTSNEILSPDVIVEIFNGDENNIGSAINNDGDYIIFHVVNVSEYEAENIAATEFIDNSIIDSLYSEFSTGLLEDAGMKINQETLSQIINPPAYGGYN
jgi:peptidyl-prolyl cis-trans isomerase D